MYGTFWFILLSTFNRVKSSPIAESSAILSEYYEMRDVVERGNACDLPGAGIKYRPFLECMRRAVARGFVDKDKALFCAEGLKSGFMCGVDVSLMTGHRWFKNYPPAIEARHAVTIANNQRVATG